MQTGRERRYAVILLIVSVAVLAGGSLLRRRFASPKPAPAQAPAPDLEILQRLTAERRLRDLSDYLTGLAAADARHLLSPAGLVWDTTVVLTAPAANPGDGFTRVNAAPHLPFAIWRPATSIAPAPRARPRRRDWILAVALDAAGQPIFAHGIYQGQSTQRCGPFTYAAIQSDAALSPSIIGGGIFTVDGALAGFVGDCEGRPVAVAASTINDVLAHPPSEAELVEQRYGLRLASEPPGLVVSVWADSTAAKAGVRPGDTVELADGELTLRRRGRVVPLAPPEPVAARGITLDPTSATVTAVAPDAPAGVEPGDLILRVGPAAVGDAASAARAIERAKIPVVLTIERHGRRMETLLRP